MRMMPVVGILCVVLGIILGLVGLVMFGQATETTEDLWGEETETVDEGRQLLGAGMVGAGFLLFIAGIVVLAVAAFDRD